MTGGLPAGWEPRTHSHGFEYYRADVVNHDGLSAALVSADPKHTEIEVSVMGTLTPDQARALAARLVEAADIAGGSQ